MHIKNLVLLYFLFLFLGVRVWDTRPQITNTAVVFIFLGISGKHFPFSSHIMVEIPLRGIRKNNKIASEKKD